MFEAALFAGVAAFGLIAGFLIWQFFHPEERIIGFAMALGAGLLMSVVAYGLIGESVETSEKPSLVGAGLALGALVYFFGDRAISSAFASGDGNQGMSLAFGAVLDGIPESLVIGISAALIGEASIPLVIGAFIANVAESLGSTPQLEEEGQRAREVSLIWLGILLASVTAAVIGYEVISRISTSGGVIFNGFAAGAVLMVLANAMIPEGYKLGGRVAGLFVVIGFAFGFALEHL